MKAKAPENSLGSYLTKENLDSIDIENRTGIPVSDVRKMRSFEIESIPAYRLYLISLTTLDPIGEVLKKVYPNLELINKGKPVSRNITEKTSETGKIIFSLEDFNLDIIAYRSGLKRDRLQRLAKLEPEKINAHELYLIEMAADREPGSLFIKLFDGLKLIS